MYNKIVNAINNNKLTLDTDSISNKTTAQRLFLNPFKREMDRYLLAVQSVGGPDWESLNFAGI